MKIKNLANVRFTKQSETRKYIYDFLWRMENFKRRILYPPGTLENWFLVAMEKQY